jgi:hypothetical protein
MQTIKKKNTNYWRKFDDKIFDNFEDDDIWDNYDLEEAVDKITPSVFDIMRQILVKHNYKYVLTNKIHLTWYDYKSENLTTK